MPRGNLISLSVMFVFSLMCYQVGAHGKYALIFREAMSRIVAEYIRPVDEETLFNAAMTGMTSPLDQNSAYIPTFDTFRRELEQEFGGIGISVELKEETDEMTVVTPLAGTPAYEAGVQAGDVILAIDDQEVDPDKYLEAVERLRGPIGSEVTLTVRQLGSDEPKKITIRRDTIRVSSVLGDSHIGDGQWKFTLDSHPRIALIRIETFGDHTAAEFKSALEEIDGQVDGLIIDLRNNAGGYLDSAVEIVDMFLDEGMIVSTQTRDFEVRYSRTASPRTTVVSPNLPVVVLSNRFSASASEIVAAALQDHDRATIVGERSFGKGTVQSVRPLDGDRRAIKITTATYHRASGENIHRFPDYEADDPWGVKPNEGYEIELPDEELEKVLRARRLRDVDRTNFADPSVLEKREMTEAERELIGFEDPQLQKAIEVIEAIEAARADR